MVDDKKLEELVMTRLMRLNTVVHGVVTGTMVGLGIFLATNWLVLKGGRVGPDGDYVIGPHLSLLGHFFIGYEVTFLGSLIGFAYGFGVGFAVGYFIAGTYNWVVERRDHRGGNQSRA